MTTPLAVVILGAGKGTRMKSSTAKVLHPLGGRPLIGHVMEVAKQLSPQYLIVVVGHQAEAVQAVCEPEGAICVRQEPQLGTGHAVAQAHAVLADSQGDVVVLCGDVPLLEFDTVQALYEEHQRQRATVTLLTACVEDPSGYGRIVRDAQGRVQRIVEARDATEAEGAIHEINSGIYCLDAPFLFAALPRLRGQNAQGEQYLTDVIGMAVDEGQTVSHLKASDPDEILGVNSRVDLAWMAHRLRQRICHRHMLAGVTIVDPAATVIELPVRIGPDTVIEPQTQILGHTRVGAGCHISSHVVIQDSTLGNGVRIEPFCHLQHHVVLAHETVRSFSALTSAR